MECTDASDALACCCASQVADDEGGVGTCVDNLICYINDDTRRRIRLLENTSRMSLTAFELVPSRTTKLDLAPQKTDMRLTLLNI